MTPVRALVESFHSRSFALRVAALALPLLAASPGLAGSVGPAPSPRAAAGGPVSVFQAYPVKKVPGELLYGGRHAKKQPGAVAGALDLATKPDPSNPGGVLFDPAAFATCPKGQRSPEVLAATLEKAIPGSALYPTAYPPATFMQQDAGIRTHWTLMYDQPGTTFTLDVQVGCTDPGSGQSVDHDDVYVWKVDATFDSLRALIRVIHAHSLGTSGIPALASEKRFLDLLAAVDEIEGLVKDGFPMTASSQIADLQTELQNDIGVGGMGVITTPENPVPEVLGATLEYLDAGLQ